MKSVLNGDTSCEDVALMTCLAVDREARRWEQMLQRNLLQSHILIILMASIRALSLCAHRGNPSEHPKEEPGHFAADLVIVFA